MDLGGADPSRISRHLPWQKWQVFPYQTYDGFAAYSDSTVDKLNFVIFVITPVLLEPKIDKTARARLSALFKPAFFEVLSDKLDVPLVGT